MGFNSLPPTFDLVSLHCNKGLMLDDLGVKGADHLSLMRATLHTEITSARNMCKR